MNIPNFFDSKLIDDNGYLLPEWKNFFQQLITQLQMNLSNTGYLVPQQPTTVIATLNTAASKTALLYDSTLDVLKVNLAGTFKTVQTM